MTFPFPTLSPPAAAAAGWAYSGLVTGSSAGGDRTFAGFAIGAASASRVCAMAMIHSGNGITAVTIGGVTATLVQAFDNSVAIYYAVVPTGESADVVATFVAGPDGGAACSIWYGYPASSAPLDSGKVQLNFGDPLVLSDLAVAPNGILIAAVHQPAGGTGSWAWNGADTIAQRASGFVVATEYKTADIVPTTVSETLSDLTFDPNAGSNQFVAASWSGP